MSQLHFTIPNFVVASGITKDDVWGVYDESYNRIKEGMVIARTGQRCVVYDEILPFKSVVIKCKKDQYSAVAFWIEYVHGFECIQGTLENADGTVYIRSDYMCW